MSTLDVALQYRNAGLSVIPVSPVTKKPALEGWLEFAERQPTEQEVREMFNGRHVNIGIVTGAVSKLVVVDIDDPSQYASFLAQYPTSRIAKTPNGYHLYYFYNGTDLKNSVKKLGEGVDIRGQHGYVVAPPSVMQGGGSYTWVDQRTPAAIPSHLADRIRRTNPLNVINLDQITAEVSMDSANLYERVKRIGFTAGAHNEELKNVARYLFRMGHDEPAIIAELHALNDLDPTPIPEREFYATIQSGLNYERQRLAAKPKQADKVFAEARAAEPEVDFDITEFGDVERDYAGRTENWLIDQWLPESAVMVTTAPPESFKTWLGLEAGIQIALGDKSTPFLGGFKGPKEPQPVLFVQQEDYMGLLSQRIATIRSAKSREASYPLMDIQNGHENERFISFGSATQAPIMLHTNAQLNFENDESLSKLEASIKKYGFKYVMIDPVYSLARADDFFASLARKMAVIKKMRDNYGTTFMFVHHNKKGTKNGKASDAGEREGMFGSQLLNGAFEGFWLINTVTNKQKIIVRRGKVFPGQMKKYAVTFDIYTGEPIRRVSYDATGGVDEIEYEDHRRYNVKLSDVEDTDYSPEETVVLELIEGFQPITQATLVAESKLTRQQVSKIIQNFVAVGRIEITPETKGKKQGIEYKLVDQF